MPQDNTETRPVKVRVNAGLKRQYTEKVTDLRRATATGATTWRERYLAAAAIVEHDPPLYLAGGYATDKAFFEGEMQESPQAAQRAIRIVKLATVDEIRGIGVFRLNLAIAYLEGESGKPIESASSVDFTKLRISFKVDGDAVTKSLTTITRQELALAVAQLPVNVAKPRKPSPAAKAVGEAVKRSGVKGAKATVTQRLLVLRVPLDGIAAIARELTGFKVPQS